MEKDLKTVETYKLENDNGMVITVTNLGCAIINLLVPDSHGKLVDVVLGLNQATDYATKPHPFFGVVAGRVANRIGGGKFALGGKEYQLETNDGANHLHGGSNGFDKKVWAVEYVSKTKIVFAHNSPCGDSDYPGNLFAKVTYELTRRNSLCINYETSTDTQTICNLTNHSYFNLNGHDAGDILDHQLEIYADKITAIDSGLVPTGEFVDVAGTPFDFNIAKPIGRDIEAAGGYDHNYVLRNNEPGNRVLVSKVCGPKTGIAMKVYTNSPGVQLYTSNMMPQEGVQGKGVVYKKHSGFCLETQIYPDAINKPHFPSCVVEKDKPQAFYTEFEFCSLGLVE